MLMDPLVSALNGSQTLVSQASCPERSVLASALHECVARPQFYANLI